MAVFDDNFFEVRFLQAHKRFTFKVGLDPLALLLIGRIEGVKRGTGSG